MMKFIYSYKIKLIFFLFILYFMVVFMIIISGVKNHLFKADLIVVLGTKVELDGTPSVGLAARLNEAINVYRQGYAPLILVSGGTGKEGYSEAHVMADYLVAHGIPKQVIVQDELGVNTRATAKNTWQYMVSNHLKSVIVVSQYYHIPRIRLALHAVGINEIGQASPSYVSWRDFFSVPREMIGYPAYWLRIK